MGSKGDRLIERRGSMGTIEELLKRKRELTEEKEMKEKGEKEDEEEEEWAFQSTKKLLRSPKGGCDEDWRGWCRELKREIMTGMRPERGNYGGNKGSD
ncbi:atp-dependent rrna helicase [Lasius niger]|uniref:Atp-dependent rrna helicase n=1 Tax=Lasius niger TaxID=67767 RepID=A0A0J7KSX6_LASNI|nr:atp-dependent rrna helicase [Lasius niger]